MQASSARCLSILFQTSNESRCALKTQNSKLKTQSRHDTTRAAFIVPLGNVTPKSASLRLVRDAESRDRGSISEIDTRYTIHRYSCSAHIIPGSIPGIYLFTAVCLSPQLAVCCLKCLHRYFGLYISVVGQLQAPSVACLASRHERLQQRETTTIRGQRRRKGEPRTENRATGPKKHEYVSCTSSITPWGLAVKMTVEARTMCDVNRSSQPLPPLLFGRTAKRMRGLCYKTRYLEPGHIS